jgi:hypothetical protein
MQDELFVAVSRETSPSYLLYNDGKSLAILRFHPTPGVFRAPPKKAKPITAATA